MCWAQPWVGWKIQCLVLVLKEFTEASEAEEKMMLGSGMPGCGGEKLKEAIREPSGGAPHPGRAKEDFRRRVYGISW